MDIHVSHELSDADWDRFLETQPDGCYQQSSLWARLKATGGWRPLRITATDGDQIIGGAQILLRSIGHLGTVGYISKGPVIASDEPTVQDYVLDELDRVCKKERVLFLKIQPSAEGKAIAQRLRMRGAQPSKDAVVPSAVACIDLRPDLEVVLARIKKTRRRAIRYAEQMGISVREGTRADLPTFTHLVRALARLQGFHGYSQEYCQRLGELLIDAGKGCLLMAECEGDVVSAMLCTYFGDVAFPLIVGDSYRCIKLSPQSLLDWRAIVWGKGVGCSWYDLADIDDTVARTIAEGRPIPDTRAGNLARYKMSFGSRLVFRPKAHDVSYVWPRSLTVRLAPIAARVRPLVKMALGGSLYGDFD